MPHVLCNGSQYATGPSDPVEPRRTPMDRPKDTVGAHRPELKGFCALSEAGQREELTGPGCAEKSGTLRETPPGLRRLLRAGDAALWNGASLRPLSGDPARWLSPRTSPPCERPGPLNLVSGDERLVGTAARPSDERLLGTPALSTAELGTTAGRLSRPGERPENPDRSLMAGERLGTPTGQPSDERLVGPCGRRSSPGRLPGRVGERRLLGSVSSLVLAQLTG